MSHFVTPDYITTEMVRFDAPEQINIFNQPAPILKVIGSELILKMAHILQM